MRASNQGKRTFIQSLREFLRLSQPELNEKEVEQKAEEQRRAALQGVSLSRSRRIRGQKRKTHNIGRRRAQDPYIMRTFGQCKALKPFRW